MELAVVLRFVGSDAGHALDGLKVTDVGLLHVRHDPDRQDTQRQGAQDAPADKAQIQHKQLPFVAPGLGLAHVQRLHHAYAGIFAQVIQGEAVAVAGDNAGDDEQQRPQKDKDAHDDLQQDHLSGKQEAVKQRGIGRFQTLAHIHGIQDIAGAQNGAYQGDHDGDKGDGHRRQGQPGEVLEQFHHLQIPVQIGVFSHHAAGSQPVQPLQHHNDHQIQQREQIG